MTTATKSTGNGIGFGTVLFLIFLTLKLCGVISWSWWWVFSPLWIPLAVVMTIVIVAGAIGVFTSRR